MVILLKNMFGLVCDFVVGFVEVFCVKCNVVGVVNVMILVDLVLVGVMSIILCDEVIEVMFRIG